jgi:hypothetical protein
LNVDAVSGTTTEEIMSIDFDSVDLLIEENTSDDAVTVITPDEIELETISFSNEDSVINLPNEILEELASTTVTSEDLALLSADGFETLIATTSSEDVFVDNASSSDEVVLVLGTSSSFLIKEEEDEVIEESPVRSVRKEKPKVFVRYLVPTKVIRGAVFEAPKIIAQWQMLEEDESHHLGLDDSANSGVQILPSGQYEIDKEFSVCALVASGHDEITSVLATINYPVNVAYRREDNFRACGREQSLVKLKKVEVERASNLLCNQLRVNNNNLLSWNSDRDKNYSYGYDQVCGQEGFVATRKASLYCATSSLAYDDPAGDYKIKLKASNTSGEFDTMENNLKYLELTNYEKDFDDIQYGMVMQNQRKYLLGDENWGNEEAPTVRNTGNTRLQIKILQNDFNLGKTGDDWNVSYQARVGSIAKYNDYYPEETSIINDGLDLGDIKNIDLAIFINNFPEKEEQVSFTGEMILSAQKIPSFSCSQ